MLNGHLEAWISLADSPAPKVSIELEPAIPIEWPTILAGVLWYSTENKTYDGDFQDGQYHGDGWSFSSVWLSLSPVSESHRACCSQRFLMRPLTEVQLEGI